jgi:ATP-dependent DNA helicase RecG
MFLTQKKRFMPMPDYIIDGNEVRVILQGKVLDERYTRLLMRQPDLALDDIILLDILQKNGQISKEAADNLRKKKLIEGRYPKVYPAENVAISTGKLDEYLDNKAYDDAFYIQKILEFLCKKGQASRQDITQLIKKHLSPLLTDEQKNKKIGNLISTKMSSKLHFVTNIGTRKAPSWVITEEGMAACKSAHPDCKKDCRKR